MVSKGDPPLALGFQRGAGRQWRPQNVAHFEAPDRADRQEAASLWHTTWLAKSCVLHLGSHRAETVQPWLTKQKSHEIFRSTASTVDISTGWDPQAKQSPTGALLAALCAAALFEPLPSCGQKEKPVHNVYWFYLVRVVIQNFLKTIVVQFVFKVIG